MEESVYKGNIILNWEVYEYERHERGVLWYLIVLVFGGSLLIYALVTQNFLFAVIVIMFGVIIGLSALRDPRQMPFIVTDVGIGIGGQFFPYKHLDNFWILYEPPEVKNVYFEFKKSLRPHLVIPLDDDEDPLVLRSALLDFLDENPEEEDEPFSDFLGRLFKI